MNQSALSNQPTCDRCGKPFAPQLKERPVKGGGAERFFKCPHCKHRYHVASITPLGVRLMQEIKQARADLRAAPRDEGLRERLNGLLAQLEPEVTK